MTYSCLFFSEGKKDKDFLLSLIDLKKFKYHTKNWNIVTDNASGCSPKTILIQCKRAVLNIEYNLIICFIDLDKLKSDYKKTWEKEKEKLEKDYSEIVIIWQINNLEEEYKKVLGNSHCSKGKLNKIAKQKVTEFINSDFWKRILKPIKEKEQILDTTDPRKAEHTHSA